MKVPVVVPVLETNAPPLLTPFFVGLPYGPACYLPLWRATEPAFASILRAHPATGPRAAKNRGGGVVPLRVGATPLPARPAWTPACECHKSSPLVGERSNVDLCRTISAYWVWWNRRGFASNLLGEGWL